VVARYEPAAQLVQADAPPVEYVPTAQGVEQPLVSVFPSTFEYVPAAQARQATASEAVELPAYLPVPHGEQPTELVYVPAVHAMHAAEEVLPVLGLEPPEGQLVQADKPVEAP